MEKRKVDTCSSKKLFAIDTFQEKEHQLSQIKADLRETTVQMEQLKKQLEAQSLTLESREIKKLKLTQQLNENLKKNNTCH